MSYYQLALVFTPSEDFRMVASISASKLTDLRRRSEHLMLGDVCTPADYDEGHVGFVHNVLLDPKESSALGADGPIYFICNSGGRSQNACEKMLVATAGI
jgi:rhodanese-related sulfurtransferase